MSWHDPARAQESAEDLSLRAELSQLLKLPARGFFEAEPTPKMIALAEDLRREALRRRHTARRRPMWMLMAAGLPLALAVGALGSWGFQHKQRADALAAAMAEKEAVIQRLAARTAAEAQAREQQAKAPVESLPAPLIASNQRPRVKTPSGELVIAIKPSTATIPETQTVKHSGQ